MDTEQKRVIIADFNKRFTDGEWLDNRVHKAKAHLWIIEQIEKAKPVKEKRVKISEPVVKKGRGRPRLATNK